jgi:hypothetical protein
MTSEGGYVRMLRRALMGLRCVAYIAGKVGAGSACCFLERGHLEDCLIIYRVITKVEVTVTASYILSPPPRYKTYFTLMDFPCHFVIDPWDTWWRSWLRLCATSRKVTGSIHDVPLELFIDIILPAACDPGVDSASNINECQDISWAKRRPALRADNLTNFLKPSEPVIGLLYLY